MVDEIVFKRVRDGQLDATGLTMTDLTMIRKVFSSTLRSMLHARIEYPKEQIEDAPSDLSRKSGKLASAEEVEKERRQR